MSLQTITNTSLSKETSNRINHNKIGNQTVPEDGFCYSFGFCINSCKYRSTCKIARTKFLLHCIVVDESKHSYYPIQYSNELTLIPEEIRSETSILEECDEDGCDNPIVYSRTFKDTYIRYAEESGKDFKIFCSQACMDSYENKLIEKGYKCTKVKPQK